MVATNSWTLQKTPRRRRCCVSLLNQLSTRLSHEAPVGVECNWKRGWAASHLRTRLVLGGPVVVQDDVQGKVGRERAVEAPQELQEFLMAMTAVTLADNLASQYVQRGEQRRGAIALAVVGHRVAAVGLDRQTRLRAVESLNLAPFVYAQHDGLVRRVQVRLAGQRGIAEVEICRACLSSSSVFSVRVDSRDGDDPVDE